MPTGIYKRRPFTENHKKNIRLGHLGRPSGMLGKSQSAESKRKTSIALKGRKRNSPSLEIRKKMSESHKGYVMPEEQRRAIGLAHKGRKRLPFTEEWKRKQSLVRLGRARIGNPLNWKHTEESKLKMSLAKRGEKAPNWQGGKSFEPYTIEFNNALKRAIRIRDKYTCCICGKEPALHCHHIDYNKKNCSLDNLIILCINCHGKTNFNRKYWIDHFSRKAQGRFDR